MGCLLCLLCLLRLLCCPYGSWWSRRRGWRDTFTPSVHSPPSQYRPLLTVPLRRLPACLPPPCRWVDATAGEEAVLAEVLERWHQPQHEGGCGDGGRLT